MFPRGLKLRLKDKCHLRTYRGKTTPCTPLHPSARFLISFTLKNLFLRRSSIIILIFLFMCQLITEYPFDICNYNKNKSTIKSSYGIIIRKAKCM